MKRPNYAKLTKRDLKVFVHNAQLALAEHVSDDKVPAIYYYSQNLLPIFHDSNFTPTELAAVLVTVAWHLVEGDLHGKSSGSKRDSDFQNQKG